MILGGELLAELSWTVYRWVDLPAQLSFDLIAKASIKAVQKWRYSPVLINGDPVEADTTVDVIFTLNY